MSNMDHESMTDEGSLDKQIMEQVTWHFFLFLIKRNYFACKYMKFFSFDKDLKIDKKYYSYLIGFRVGWRIVIDLRNIGSFSVKET